MRTNSNGKKISSPIPKKLSIISNKLNNKVKKGDICLIAEALKMQNQILEDIIQKTKVSLEQVINTNKNLISILQNDPDSRT
ncbi:MAG: Glutaconyl-CoA decarboxylase subunit gamma [Pelotomaculum sp. PtaB.Bin013]|uniref:Uncharacterized protein n=1 Tax=Pelotomaculum isophthalicicum JI TaxID=947010 RepID=A0A9X4JWP8_9FIRM|nr:hypothetical protein [Pelotomaculum isophthalicicum]MDF9409882.1 hypothetical protein [Pelotomaculum isophthalicicum JI]OPX80836.1 MAG: Glutaconyl-CoA decarboxylase subunit gamma [Pelotomaculum sp. PtaB.Bin013]